MTSIFDVERAKRPRWFRQWTCAVVDNARELALWSLVYGADGIVLSPLEAAQGAALIARAIPYRWPRPTGFLSEAQSIVGLGAARRRGFAACGDATAATAAAVLIAGGECVICYETLPSFPEYAHVRIDVGGEYVDAYPEASFDVPSCSGRETVTRERVRWPVASAEMLRLLDESRRKTTPRL